MKILKLSLKILAGIIGLLIVLAIVGYFSLTHWINPNDFKPEIVSIVKQETGRDFTLTGNLSWDFFPTVGIHLGPASLSNPEGFNQATFAEIESADLSLNWNALLHGHVAINQITLNGLQLFLINDKNKNNWTFPSSSTSAAETEGSDAALSLMLDEIDINNAMVTYDDLQSKTHYALNNLNVVLPDFSLISPMNIKASGNVASDDLSGNFKLDTFFFYDQAKNTLSFNNTALNTHFTYINDNNQNIPIVLNASGNVMADLTHESVNLSGMSFNLNQNLTGTLNAKLNNFSNLNYSGDINISSFSLANLLTSFGKSLPNFPNKDQFSTMSLQANVIGDFNKIALSNLKLGLGGSLIQGNLNINSFSSFALNADLTANQLDIADFVDLKGARLPIQNIAFKGNLNAKGNDFNNVNYSGNLAIQHFSLADIMGLHLPKLPNKNQFANMSFRGNVAGNLNAIDLSKFTLGLDKSMIQGDLHILSFTPLVMKENLTANQLDLADFVNLNGARLPMKNIAMSGGNSFNSNNFPATLNASQKITIQDVVLKGFDLGALLNQVDVIVNNILNLKAVSNAYATIESQLNDFENSQGPVNADNGKQTDFGSVNAQIEIKDGVITTPTMTVSGPLVKVAGQGTIDLNQQTMDYHLNAQVIASSRNIIKTLNIPYNISGPFSNLQQGVNMASVTQQMVQFVLIQIGRTVTSVVKTVVTAPVDVVTGVGKGAVNAVGAVGTGVGEAAGGVAKGIAGALSSIFGKAPAGS